MSHVKLSAAIRNRVDNKIQTVFMDMDGVLVDWSGGVCDLLGIDPTEPLIRRIMKDDKPLEDHFLEGGKDEFIKRIEEAGYDFWYNLKLLPWARDLMSLVNNTVGEHNVYFLSSPAHFSQALSAKFQYSMDVFGHDRLVVTKHKTLLARADALLVDDMPYNTVPFSASGGMAVDWPNQWMLLDGEADLSASMANVKQALEEKSLHSATLA